MRKVLIIVCCLMSYVALSQEQITRFENRGYETPNGVQKLDTINGKLVFFINRQEKDGNKLWITDGLPENTQLLRDDEGHTIDGYPWIAKAYEYLYMNFPYSGLYRTKGDFLEKVLPKPDSLLSINQFNAKILLYFGHIEQSPYNENLNFSHLDWLSADNTITRLASNVLRSQIIDSTLHYVSTDYQTGNLELCKLDKNGRIIKNIALTNGTKYNINSFQYFSISGHDFYFFYTDKGTKLISTTGNSDEAVPIMDWGDQTSFPNIVSDTAGQIYFLKQSTLLKLYALQKDNSLIEKWTVSAENIRKVEPFMNGGVMAYQSFRIIGDKLVFNSITTSIANYGYYIHLFDLKSGANKISKNLYQFSNYGPTTINISISDTNIFVLDNTIGMRLTYNFEKDSVTSIEKYPFEFPSQKDTLITINKETLLLKSNIYNITNGIKVPLIPTREIFQQYDNHLFTYKTLIDKIVFFKYNPISRHSEIWASKGAKDDIQLIAEFSDNNNYLYFYTRGSLIQKNGRLYFYMNTAEGRAAFYETDGTKDGTIKVYETPEPSGIDHYQTKYNDKFIVFGLRGTDSKGQILVLENGHARLISFPVQAYYEVLLSNNEVYILCTKDTYKELYKVVGSEAKLVDTYIEEVSLYQDYVLYTKNVDVQGDRYALFTVDKANKPIRFVAHNINTYSIVGSRLVYTYRVNQGLVTSVFDLDAAKLEVDRTVGTFDNGKVYLNDVLVMVRDAQALFIRGTNVRVFDIGFPARYGLIAFAGGVLFLGEKDILYYNMSDNKTYRVLRAQSYHLENLKRLTVKEGEYFLIQVQKADYSYQWAYWALSEKQLNYLDKTISWFPIVNPTGAFSSSTNNRMSYWYYNGWRLIEKYPLPEYTNNNSILQTDGKAFALFKTTETGNELYQFGSDSLIAYPEIVKGPEGVEIKDLFEFNKQIYVYGFTYTHGWQVWKMGESKSFITNTESPEESFKDNLVIYPNPTQDFLFIKTDKTLSYKLINTRGQILMQGNLSPQQGIDMKQLAQGVYLVQLFDGGSIYVSKIVKE